jgi:hypothetical protein
LASQFQFANTERFVFAGLLFLFSLGLLLFITFKRHRNEKGETDKRAARASNNTVKVEQQVQELGGELLGAEAEEISQANIHVE